MPIERKVLVTAAGPNMEPVLNDISLPTFERFAGQHGYAVHVEQLGADSQLRKDVGAKTARWRKIGLMREALDEYDVAAWFDADVLIRRYDEDIASHLGPSHFQGLVLHRVPAENRINPNTGVWVMRRTPEAVDFLEAVDNVGMPDGRWADQGAVMRALEWRLGDEMYHGARPPLNHNRFFSGTRWLPIGWNQPYCENRRNPEAYIGRPTVPDPHVVHFMAMTIEERLVSMPQVANSIQVFPHPGGSI